MPLTIHQPEYMPWLGFFHKISIADTYVALDNVQYRHRYFQNRNKIRAFSKEAWLNVPVFRKGKRAELIKDVEINNSETRWRQKIWKTIFLNYEKAPYFDRYAPYFEALYAKEWRLLADLNLDIIKNCLRFLGLKTRIIRSSELGVEGQGPQLVLEICKALKADLYISGVSGIGGRGRSFESEFDKCGIKILYDEFHHPIYRQLREPFIAGMSVIDLLFNHGDKSLDIINGVNVPTMEKVFL